MSLLTQIFLSAACIETELKKVENATIVLNKKSYFSINAMIT